MAAAVVAASAARVSDPSAAIGRGRTAVDSRLAGWADLDLRAVAVVFAARGNDPSVAIGRALAADWRLGHSADWN